MESSFIVAWSGPGSGNLTHCACDRSGSGPPATGRYTHWAFPTTSCRADPISPAPNTVPPTDSMQIANSPAVAPPSPVFLPLITPTPQLQAVVLPASPAPPLLTSEISDSPDVDQDMGEAPTSPGPPSHRTSPEPQMPPPPTSSPATSPVPSPSTTVPATESFVSSLQGSLPKFITPEVVEHFNGITNVPGWSDRLDAVCPYVSRFPPLSLTSHVPGDQLALWQ